MLSMVLLSIGILAIQGAIRQTIIVRGQARDYTQARFLIEEVLAKVELQPQLVEGSEQGQFGGDFWDDGRSTEAFSRFRWSWKVSKVDVPLPAFPSFATPEEIRNFKLAAGYVTKIEAAVVWERGGRTFKEVYQTLYPPEKLYVPKPLPGAP